MLTNNQINSLLDLLETIENVSESAFINIPMYVGLVNMINASVDVEASKIFYEFQLGC